MRVKKYCNYCYSFFAGLITNLDEEAFLAKLEEEKNKTINAKVDKSERPVHGWYTKEETLHNPKCSGATNKVSRGISNKMNVFDLYKTDPIFAKLWTTGAISGVEGYKSWLKAKQFSFDGNKIMFNGEGFNAINTSIVNQISKAEVEKLKTRVMFLKEI